MNDAMVVRHIRRVLASPLTLRLYVATGGTEATIVEATGGGYTPATYTADYWIIDGKAGKAEGRIHEFRFDGTKRLRPLGAFMTEADGGLFWIKAFEEIKDVGRQGDVIPVRPVYTMGVIS